MPQLSKEEKNAQKEANRLEKLRVEAEALKQLKRDELHREITAQALRRGELDKSWREMMLKIKEPVFKQDIEVMWRVFERTYDKKDHLVNYTVKLINIADDQFQKTISSFCDTIDTMINKFLIDLEDMSNENQQRTADLLKRGENDASRIVTDHDVAETHLQLLIYHEHTTSDTLAWIVRGENLVKEDEEKNKYLNERDNLKSLLENKFNATWEEYKSVLKAYVAGTADNQKKVRKLRKKENTMADIIASQGKKIANSGGLLKRLRAELCAYESGTKQAAFRDRRNRHRVACSRLKQNLINECESDKKQLSMLVNASDDAVDWLEAAHKKGEKILRFAALCRKFETQHEKVMPFGSTIYLSTAKDNSRKHISEDSLVSNAISSTCGLTRLWHRIAKVELCRRALLKEKMLLERQNEIMLKEIEDSKEMSQHEITNEKQCLCNNTNGKKPLQPTAVEGSMEASKYNFL